MMGLRRLLTLKSIRIFLQIQNLEFFSADILREQVNREYEKDKEKYSKSDEFYIFFIEELEQKREGDLEAITALENKKRKRTYVNTKKADSIEKKISECQDMRKNKTIIEFNDSESSSVKTIAVKSNTSIKCTTRFMSGKLLMFAKLSLKSFIYSLFELLAFPEENPIVQGIYEKYHIEKIYCYHVLTDTDSTSLQFIIVSHPDSTFPECDVRDILFEIFSSTEIKNRFDNSDEFWKKFDVHIPQNQKVLGLYEVENINDPCLVTLPVNPKEYLKYFRSENVNKKHKGIKKGSVGMNFENFAERIKQLYDFDTFFKPKNDTKPVVRISLKKGEMTTHKIVKTKFSQLNDKRFYFPNAMISLPFGHSSLEDIHTFKKSKGQRIEWCFLKGKEKLLELEKKALKQCPRLDFLNNNLLQVIKVVPLKTIKFDKDTVFQNNKNNKNVIDFVLDSGWKSNIEKITPTMESLRVTSS